MLTIILVLLTAKELDSWNLRIENGLRDSFNPELDSSSPLINGYLALTFHLRLSYSPLCFSEEEHISAWNC